MGIFDIFVKKMDSHQFCKMLDNDYKMLSQGTPLQESSFEFKLTKNMKIQKNGPHNYNFLQLMARHAIVGYRREKHEIIFRIHWGGGTSNHCFLL